MNCRAEPHASLLRQRLMFTVWAILAEFLITPPLGRQILKASEPAATCDQLPTIPCLHLDRVEIQTGIDDIKQSRSFRHSAWIRPRSMIKLIPRPRGTGKTVSRSLRLPAPPTDPSADLPQDAQPPLPARCGHNRRSLRREPQMLVLKGVEPSAPRSSVGSAELIGTRNQ